MNKELKEAGIEIDEKGNIKLPGHLEPKPKKEKVTRAKRTPGTPKPFNGFTAKVHSTGRMPLERIADGLLKIKKYLGADSATKISTTKDEFRVALKTKKASEMLAQMNEQDRKILLANGWNVPDGKEYFMLKIC